MLTLSPTARVAVYCGLLALGYWAGSSVSDYDWSRKWSDAERDAAQAQINAVGTAVAAYRRRVTELEKVTDETKQLLADAYNAARDADAESGRLQLALDDYVRGPSAAAASPTVARECAAAATDNLVLADLFRRADKRAGELAAIADQAITRGLACERSYSAAVK